MAIPLDGRIFWTGLYSAIPAGWTQDTSYVGRFLQGFTSAGSTGGAADHDHGGSADNHAPTGIPHTHPLTISGAATGTIAKKGGSTACADQNHAHASATSQAATETYQNTAVSISATDGRPPYTTGIVLKPTVDGAPIPEDGVVFTDATIAPGAFEVTDGNNGTTDLDDQFVLSADEDADGGDTGGSTDHPHTSTVHNHTPDGHLHSDSFFSQASVSVGLDTTISGVGVSLSTHHKATRWSTVNGTIQGDTVVFDNESSDPAYTQLLGIQNRSAVADTPLGTIIPFIGSTIPHNWLLCDGNYGTPDLTACQIKVTASGGSVGGIGGDDEHDHSSPEHDHRAGFGSPHQHTFSFSSVNSKVCPSGAVTVSTSGHGHTSSGMGVVLPIVEGQTVTMPSVDKRYLYKTVKFIKYMGLPAVHFGAVA